MKSLLTLTLAAALTCALPAWACTPKKPPPNANNWDRKWPRLTEQNPTKAKEINAELQKMDLGTASKDLPDKCQLIDQRLKELGSAEKRPRVESRRRWPVRCVGVDFAGPLSGIKKPDLGPVFYGARLRCFIQQPALPACDA